MPQNPYDAYFFEVLKFAKKLPAMVYIIRQYPAWNQPNPMAYYQTLPNDSTHN